MKKIAFFLAMLLSFVCGVSPVFAKTEIILIGSAVDDGGLVTVTGRIKEPSGYQRYTASVVKYKETDGYVYKLSDAVHIGTYESAEVALNNGIFTFSFKGNLEDNEKYLIRIGGSDAVMKEKELGVMGEDPGPGVENPPTADYVLGDVNGDGKVKAEDASLLLQFVLDKDSVPKEITESDNFFERCNVTGGEELTASQVAYILQKALNENFKFPAANSAVK